MPTGNTGLILNLTFLVVCFAFSYTGCVNLIVYSFEIKAKLPFLCGQHCKYGMWINVIHIQNYFS